MVRLLAVLVVAQIMSVANANLIAVALPPLSADLGASAVQEQWIVDAYVLVFAALLVAGGVLADRYGRRRALLAGFALFGVGSLVSALAPDPGVLIAARVVQALGPPLILPASLAILTANLPDPAARARAIGYWGAGFRVRRRGRPADRRRRGVRIRVALGVRRERDRRRRAGVRDPAGDPRRPA